MGKTWALVRKNISAILVYILKHCSLLETLKNRDFFKKGKFK
jgi:hypothetical protein